MVRAGKGEVERLAQEGGMEGGQSKERVRRKWGGRKWVKVKVSSKQYKREGKESRERKRQ